MKAPLIGAGFVRSWKLNLRLTTRAEDNHAAPDLNLIHFRVLPYVVHTYSVADDNDYRFIEYTTYTKVLQFKFKGW
jgi:hypothetical protein